MKKYLFFGAICLAMFVVNLTNTVQGILLTNLIDNYSLVSANQGLMVTAQSLGCLVVSILVLLLSGRIQRQNMIIISVALITGSMLFIGLLPAYGMVLLLYGVYGMGHASTSNVASSLTSAFLPGAVFMGILHAVHGVGGLVGPILFQHIRTSLPEHWNYVYYLAALISAVVLLLYLLSCRAASGILRDLGTQENNIRLRDIKEFLGEHRNVLLMISAFCYTAFQYGVSVWVARYTEVALDARAYSAIILSVFWGGNTVSRVLVPRIKAPAQRLLCGGCLISALSLLLGVLSGDPRVLLGCVLVCGLSSGAAIPLYYFLGTKWNPQSPLLSTSFLGAVFFLGSMTTAPLTATLASRTIATGMTAIAVYALVSGVSMLPLLRRAN